MTGRVLELLLVVMGIALLMRVGPAGERGDVPGERRSVSRRTVQAKIDTSCCGIAAVRAHERGLEVLGVGKRDTLGLLGFRAGDVWTSLNGRALGADEDVAWVVGEVRAARRLTIGYQRKGVERVRVVSFRS